MKFRISHNTEYLFDSEVFIEPHYLRFRPKETPYLDLESYSLSIEPTEKGRKTVLDEENNLIDFCWFEGMTKKLAVKAESILETNSFNPFDFILDPINCNQLPLQYSESQRALLNSSLSGVLITEALAEFGSEIQEKSDNNTVSYLANLTNQIHDDCEVVYREEGPPMSPEDTFQAKKGSCRDLSWMQINLLRYQGFAARFVSGYYYFEMEEPSYELHAWVEVFLPGAGWIGLDPSHGIFTGMTHIPLASSSNYDKTMPVSGTIRGSATSILNNQLLIEVI